MVKKFKCRKCGQIFEAEEEEVKYCPKCLSSDIVPYKSKMPLYLCMGALFIAAVLAFALWPTGTSSGSKVDETTVETPPVAPPMPEPGCSDCVYKLIESAPKKTGSTYSYTVTTEPKLSSADVEYKLSEDEQHTVCESRSSNGQFTAVNPSTTGIYYLVICKDKKEVLSSPVSGFDKPIIKPAPSVSDLHGTHVTGVVLLSIKILGAGGDE